MSDTGNSDYYKQATTASVRGEFDSARKICNQAIEQFERTGEERNASVAYHLMGEITYRQGDLAEAESWFQKALAIDHRTGDDWGAARTYNSLSALATARGEYDLAGDWIGKAIHTQEMLVDERGLAASYIQWGHVAVASGDFDAAKKSYLNARDIYATLRSDIGAAKAGMSLCAVAEKQGNKNSSEEWRQEAMQSLQRHGSAVVAVNLGREAERLGRCEDALHLYRKAIDIAKEHKDDEGQSLSYRNQGHLACGLGYNETAKECYEKSIEIDERIHERPAPPRVVTG